MIINKGDNKTIAMMDETISKILFANAKRGFLLYMLEVYVSDKDSITDFLVSGLIPTSTAPI